MRQELQAAAERKDWPQVHILSHRILQEPPVDGETCQLACFYLSFLEKTVSESFKYATKALQTWPAHSALLGRWEECKSSLMESAKQALTGGDKKKARELLGHLREAAPNNEQVWSSLCEASETDDERFACLQRILEINPHNQNARRQLEALQENRKPTTPSDQAAGPASDDSSPEPKPALEDEMPPASRQKSKTDSGRAFSNLRDLGAAVAEELRQAYAESNYKRLYELLSDHVTAGRDYLYAEAEAKLIYRKPSPPSLREESALRKKWEEALKLSRNGNPDELHRAIEITKEVWQEDFDNWGLPDWLAHLYHQTNDGISAEMTLEMALKPRRESRRNFLTQWNLAVLAYQRRDTRRAFQVLLTAFKNGATDAELVTALLALSHQLEERETFLLLVPHLPGRKFLPLAFVVAYELGDEGRQKKFLYQLLKKSRWKLPPADTRIDEYKILDSHVNRAIIEGQSDQLVHWLEARIKTFPNWLTQYRVLARVLEEHGDDLDEAFRVLRECFEQAQKDSSPDPRSIDANGRELLEFCRRNNRTDLGKQAYQIVGNSTANPDVLRSFSDYAMAKNGTFSHAFGQEKIGIFIDHENLIESLAEISAKRGRSLPGGTDKVAWLDRILKNLLREAVKRAGELDYKFVAAFWNRQREAPLLPAYRLNDFTAIQPEELDERKQKNAVDFKLADEVRRAQLHALSERSHLRHVIIVSGDSDYVHIVRNLVDEGIRVQIWGGSREMSQIYAGIVGKNSLVMLDDVCGI